MAGAAADRPGGLSSPWLQGYMVFMRAGARENNNAVALCFNPRHGIRVRQGDSVLDLVICFECLQVEVFEGEQRAASFLTSDSPQSVFDEVLRLSAKPAKVSAATAALKPVEDLREEGYTVRPLPDGDWILRVHHRTANEVTISY